MHCALSVSHYNCLSLCTRHQLSALAEVSCVARDTELCSLLVREGLKVLSKSFKDHRKEEEEERALIVDLQQVCTILPCMKTITHLNLSVAM